MSITDDELLEESLRIAGFVVAPRALFVSVIYFLSLQMLDVTAGKAIVISFTLYVMMRLPLGRRHIDRFAFLIFFVAAIYWVDLLPLRKWTKLTMIAVDAKLSSTLTKNEIQ